MRKTPVALILICVFLSCAGSVGAAQYDNFRNISGNGLKPFARDLGGLLGSGLNQTARPLGFSGFDIGIRTAAQFNPSSGNNVLKKNNIFGIGFVQAEIGMPYRVDGFVRAASFEGLSVVGGGLRYGLWNVSDATYHINAMLVFMASMAANRYFYATHFNTSLVCSMNIPVVAPYFSVGADSTKLEAQNGGNPALLGKTVRVLEPRYSAGLRAKLNLGYLAAGLTYTHDRMLVNASAGMRF